jgi:hypothetical protein
MFLLGGPAFSGKTLLALLLNQGQLVCLDEPDFQNPAQGHRGIPVLRTLFPDLVFPDQPDRALGWEESVAFLARCEEVIRPRQLGMKTAGRTFIEYARVYQSLGWPVLAVIRDIRDVLAEAPLPGWMDEQKLNRDFRSIWAHLDLCHLWIRYEDLVADPGSVIRRIGECLTCDLEVADRWAPGSVHLTMFKLDRHEMLRLGRISSERVGIWRHSGLAFSDETRATAEMMGYGA